jgi:hypothetical protein
MCYKEVNQMNEQIQAREPRQRRTVVPTIFMIAGIIFLAASIFILATGVGLEHGLGNCSISTPGYYSSCVPMPLVLLRALTPPGILFGVMLFLIGLVNTTKKPSLRWLRITVSILCSILIGLAVIWSLLVSVLLFSGF